MQPISIIKMLQKYRKSPRRSKWPATSSSRDARRPSSAHASCVMLTHILTSLSISCFSTGTRGWNGLLIPWGKPTSFIPSEFSIALVTKQKKKTLCSSHFKHKDFWPWDWACLGACCSLSLTPAGVYLLHSFMATLTLIEKLILDFYLSLGWGSVHPGQIHFS